MSRASTSETVFVERLLPKIPGLLPLILIVPAFWLVLLPLSNSTTGLTAGVVAFGAVTGLRLVMAKRIVASKKGLILGQVVIPAAQIVEIHVFDKYQIKREMGPALDARALRFFASSANYLLKIKLKNASFPYALISTNRPERLIQELGR